MTKQNKQQARAMKTRQDILTAAGELFSTRDFNTVTMREIAARAGCSHTAIYMYYKNKMSLLHELAVEPLTSLLKLFQDIKDKQGADSPGFIKSISLKLITFAFDHRSMYDLFFTTEGERVDTVKPEHEVNHLRIQLFNIFKSAINEIVPSLTDDQALQHTRMFFYMLHGMIKTYLDNDESAECLTTRLTPILNEAVDVLLLGIYEHHQAK